jgi:hypothetical protein
MKAYEGARGLDGAIVIIDGKPLPPRHGEPTSRRNSPRNRWFESVSLPRRVCEISVPLEMRDRTGRSGLASVVAVRVSPASYATSCDVIL